MLILPPLAARPDRALFPLSAGGPLRSLLRSKRSQIPLQVLVEIGPLRLTNIFIWVTLEQHQHWSRCSVCCSTSPAWAGRSAGAGGQQTRWQRVLGVPVDRVVDLAWVLVGGMAGVAGAGCGDSTPSVNPLVGWLILLPVFCHRQGWAACRGFFVGTILGAYIVAFGENTVMLTSRPDLWPRLQFQTHDPLRDHHPRAANSPARLWWVGA
ncbi:MAG: hypothetical protein V9G24_16340 [Rhodoblastus sp.]